MNAHHTTIRDLTGNPHLEALELQDANAHDLTPADRAGLDAAFGYGTPADELTEREIDRLYEQDMARRDMERQADRKSVV